MALSHHRLSENLSLASDRRTERFVCPDESRNRKTQMKTCVCSVRLLFSFCRCAVEFTTVLVLYDCIWAFRLTSD